MSDMRMPTKSNQSSIKFERVDGKSIKGNKVVITIENAGVDGLTREEAAEHVLSHTLRELSKWK